LPWKNILIFDMDEGTYPITARNTNGMACLTISITSPSTVNKGTHEGSVVNMIRHPARQLDKPSSTETPAAISAPDALPLPNSGRLQGG
jgi:hypothetical protein